MINKMVSERTKKLLSTIARAVEKGIGEDINAYYANSDNVTNNAIIHLRGDYINTNIRNLIDLENVDVRIFPRRFWKGCIVVDRVEKKSYSVCSKRTLERIPKNYDRKSPHFLQTIFNVENKNEDGEGKQISLFDMGMYRQSQFSEEEYEQDFYSIMDGIINSDDDYRHWVVSYEASRGSLLDISAILFDKDFCLVRDISLVDMLKPDFGNMTNSESSEERKPDVRNLLSVKGGLKSDFASEKEMHVEITPKTKENKTAK